MRSGQSDGRADGNTRDLVKAVRGERCGETCSERPPMARSCG